MEKQISIKTPDGHIIYGILDSPEEKSDKLVIFVHGFTGNCNEHIFFNGAKYLRKQSIASFRFDLYSWQKKARAFPDCTTETHVLDLRTVYNYLHNEYSQIYLIGHSWGGIVVLESKLDVSGIILWDSAHPDCPFTEREYEYNKALNAYLLKWGLVFLVGKKMHDQTMKIKPARDLISGIHSPLKVICAGRGELIKGGREYCDLAKEPKSFAIIEGAGHTFDEEGTEKKLFEETANWLKEF